MEKGFAFSEMYVAVGPTQYPIADDPKLEAAE